METVFVHPERCIGCKQCEAACAVAHSLSKNLFWAALEEPRPVPRIHAEPGIHLNTAFPNKCRHCDPAPCLAVCPTRAITRAAVSGGSSAADVVLIEAARCIGCGMCAMVCPFDVITYHASREAPDRQRVAIKCDECTDRQREGRVPACVEACKTGALEFGEINEITRAGRTIQAQIVTGGTEADGNGAPPLLEAWRDWGEAVTRLNTAAT